MRNPKIDMAIKKAKVNKKYDNMQLLNFSGYINIAAQYLKNEYSKLDITQLQAAVFNDLDNINRDFTTIGNLRGRYFQLIAAREVIKDKEFIKSEAEKIKDLKIDENELVFTGNYKKNKEIVVKQIWEEYSKIDKEKLKQVEKYAIEKEKKNKKNGQVKLDSIDKKIKRLVGKPEEIIYENLKYQILVMEQELKDEIINILEFLGKFFDRFNLLDRYVNKHSSNMIGIDCLNLRYELSTGKYDLDNIGAKELFSKQVLEQLDVDTLMMLNMFYQNRFSKEISSIGEAIFVIDTLDLWENAKNEGRIELKTEELSALKNKINCLDNISSRLFEEIINQENAKPDKNKEGYRAIDIKEKIERIHRHSGNEYKSIFDKQLPSSENFLERDLAVYKTIANIRDNVYLLREAAFSTLLYSLIKQKSSKNFGVIKNEYVDEKYVNKLNSRYVLIGIDYEGLNMPIRLHVNKANLIDTLNTFFGNSIIQEYEGGEDFIIGKELIATNLLMPIPKRHKKAINELYKQSKGKKKEKFISHIRFLKEPGMGKYPKHLMQEKITPKGVKYVLKPKKYINLQTGEEYILDENNNLIPEGGELEFE